jgi:hypothetical protein
MQVGEPGGERVRRPVVGALSVDDEVETSWKPFGRRVGHRHDAVSFGGNPGSVRQRRSTSGDRHHFLARPRQQPGALRFGGKFDIDWSPRWDRIAMTANELGQGLRKVDQANIDVLTAAGLAAMDRQEVVSLLEMPGRFRAEVDALVLRRVADGLVDQVAVEIDLHVFIVMHVERERRRHGRHTERAAQPNVVRLPLGADFRARAFTRAEPPDAGPTAVVEVGWFQAFGGFRFCG